MGWWGGGSGGRHGGEILKSSEDAKTSSHPLQTNNLTESVVALRPFRLYRPHPHPEQRRSRFTVTNKLDDYMPKKTPRAKSDFNGQRFDHMELVGGEHHNEYEPPKRLFQIQVLESGIITVNHVLK